jgi:hypothetical protein
MARVIAIWVFGLFASALIGGMIAHYFYGSDVDVFGALAGMAAFACGRIWSMAISCTVAAKVSNTPTISMAL